MTILPSRQVCLDGVSAPHCAGQVPYVIGSTSVILFWLEISHSLHFWCLHCCSVPTTHCILPLSHATGLPLHAAAATLHCLSVGCEACSLWSQHQSSWLLCHKVRWVCGLLNCRSVAEVSNLVRVAEGLTNLMTGGRRGYRAGDCGRESLV